MRLIQVFFLIVGMTCLVGCASVGAQKTYRTTVAIVSEGTVVVRGQEVTPDQVGNTLNALGVPKNELVTFTVNGALPWRYVQDVMHGVHQAGYTKLSTTEVE